jgi:hypothetical protein
MSTRIGDNSSRVSGYTHSQGNTVMKAAKSRFAVALAILITGPGQAQIQNESPKPLGRMVDVGGYRIHLYCLGSGNPTVVITGAGYSFDWSLVQPGREEVKLAPAAARFPLPGKIGGILKL